MEMILFGYVIVKKNWNLKIHITKIFKPKKHMLLKSSYKICIAGFSFGVICGRTKGYNNERKTKMYRQYCIFDKAEQAAMQLAKTETAEVSKGIVLIIISQGGNERYE